jgi:ABC-type multidrug transport system fused ATPase/permease subunit
MLKFYWKIIFRPYLFRIILITAATTISSLMEIASIGLVVPLITLVISPAEMNGSWTMTLINTALFYVNIPPNSNVVIFSMVFAVSILVLAKNVFYITQAYWVSLLSTDISNLFRTRMFRSYLYASYAEIARRGRGSIYQDIDAASTNIFVIVRIASFLLYSAIYVVAVLALMMYLSWWGTLIVGGLALLSIRYMRSVLEHHSRRIGAETHNLAQRRSTLLVDAIDGARVVKIHAREDVVVSHLDKFQGPLKSLNAQSALLANFPTAFFEISGALLVALLIGLVINLPSLGLTLPVLAGMVLALRRLQPAASAVNNNLIELSRLLKQVEIADEVLNQLPSEVSGSYKF